MFKLNKQTIVFETVHGEFHVSQIDDETRERVRDYQFKEHEIVDALAKYDDLILLQQIKCTLARKAKSTGY